MQIVRTIVWVLLLFALLAFSFFNWKPVEVQIWSNLVLETRLPALVVVAFLLGLVPMWLVHRASKWQMRRRMTALETATARLSTPGSDRVTETPAQPAAAAPPTDHRPVDAPRPFPSPGASAAEPANPVDPEPTKPA